MKLTDAANRRILIVDDNTGIHADFASILTRKDEDAEFDAVEAELFGETKPAAASLEFELEYATQGQAGAKLVEESPDQWPAVRRGLRGHANAPRLGTVSRPFKKSGSTTHAWRS